MKTRIVVLMLAALAAAPVFAQEKRPGPACTPYLNREHAEWNDPAKISRQADCIVEMQRNNYKIAQRVWGIGLVPEALRKDALARGMEAGLREYKLTAAIAAEFGKACEKLKYIYEDRDDPLQFGKMSGAIDLGACLAELTSWHPKETEKTVMYLQSLVDAGTIPSLSKETFEDPQYLPYVEAAIRNAFGYNPPKVINLSQFIPKADDQPAPVPAVAHTDGPVPALPLRVEPSTLEPQDTPKPGLLDRLTRGDAPAPVATTKAPHTSFERVKAGVSTIIELALFAAMLILLIGPLRLGIEKSQPVFRVIGRAFKWSWGVATAPAKSHQKDDGA